MKTQSEIRAAFWDTFPQFATFYRKNKRQNDYNADIRMTFVDWVDSLSKDGIISQKLAERVTL